jgi:drug/metabolite transporter (DMT)-like permease
MGHGHSHGYLFELGEKRLWRAVAASCLSGFGYYVLLFNDMFSDSDYCSSKKKACAV